MGSHSLGGKAKIEVTKVSASFASRKPMPEEAKSKKLLKFGEPEGRDNTADIKFVFKGENLNDKFQVGIKQFIQTMDMSADYKGNKDIDGFISESYKTGALWTLDCATAKLEVLFEPGTDISTGAQATAAQAPFYSDQPAFILRNGTDIELSIIDKPGGVYPLELRNGATDRVTYLQKLRRLERFLTVLTAVKPDGSHVPLEAVNWQHRIEGDIVWDEQGKPSIDKVVSECKGLGRFPDIPETFLYADYGLLANRSLTVADCMVQKFNDALYAVRGLHKRQDFSHPPRKTVLLAVKGYELRQYPSWPRQ